MRYLRRLRAGRPAAVLVSVICLCLGWAAVGAGPASAAPTPFLTGVSNVYSNDVAAFHDVRRAGGSLVLSPLRWEVIAPAQQPAIWNPEDPADPHYEWRFFDDWVRRAVAAGLTPILDVRSAPRWAQGCTPTAKPSASPTRRRSPPSPGPPCGATAAASGTCPGSGTGRG